MERHVRRAPRSRVPEDHWQRRVFLLGDGRSVAEIVEWMYWDEVRAGAWAVDIAFWSDAFAGSVLATIEELAAMGSLLLVEPKDEQPPPEAFRNMPEGLTIN